MRRAKHLQAAAAPADAASLLEEALRGTDRVIAAQQVTYQYGRGRPPRWLRQRPEVTPSSSDLPLPKRIAAGLTGFFGWLLDPLSWFEDLVADRIMALFTLSRKKRYWRKHLKGGWKSTAGKLMGSNFGAGARYLVRGGRGLHLVQLTPPAQGMAWSVGLEQFRGAEMLDPRKADAQPSTLRCHFTDGSWADVMALGPGWRKFLERVPAIH